MKSRALGIVIFLLGAAGAASAGQDDSRSGGGDSHDWVNDYWGGSKSHDWFDARSAPTLQAPSIDQDNGHGGGGKLRDWVNESWGGGKSHDWFDADARKVPTLIAPELDTVAMVAALTLLGGVFAVSRGRRTYLRPALSMRPQHRARQRTQR
jgi:hypothetical protein